MNDTTIANFGPSPCRNGVIPLNRMESQLDNHEGWEFLPQKPVTYQGEHRSKFVLKRMIAPKKYLTVYGYNDVIDGFKVSLPNLLYGHNARLPTSQAELDRALARVAELVSEISPVHLTSIPLQFVYLHLTLQVRWPGVSAQQFFTCFRNARHPRIQADAVEWKVRGDRSGIQLRGTNLEIGAYDKRLERDHIPGDVVRFEIKLRKHVLKELLGPGDDEFPTWLQFDRCYEAFRGIMLGFPSVRSLQARCPQGHFRLSRLQAYMVTLLADLARQGVTLTDGVDLLSGFSNFCRQNYTRGDTGRRMLAAIAATQLNDLEIDFAEIFPPEWPPQGLVADLYADDPA
ncbi:hypothetical protein [Haloferula sp. A504]|uniref:hypothetical protein n=1 Tax=Haloferula sp. A504 TaxID=3373601 RepID=UPI0031C087A3|nr:hypothetical protein [Verrucomicrobiaceae bacterium E54]